MYSKKSSLDGLFKFIFLSTLLLGLCEFNLFAQNVSNLDEKLDSIQLEPKAEFQDEYTSDSCISLASDMKIYINAIREAESFLYMLNEIDKELEIVDSLMKFNDYSKLDSLLEDYFFLYIRKNISDPFSWENRHIKYNREPISRKGKLYIEYRPITFFNNKDKSYNIAFDHLRKRNYRRPFELDNRILKEYPQLRKKLKIYFIKKYPSGIQIDDLEYFKNNKDEYAVYLLRLIEDLLFLFDFDESKYNDYIIKEQKMNLTIDGKINIRYKFLVSKYEMYKDKTFN